MPYFEKEQKTHTWNSYCREDLMIQKIYGVVPNLTFVEFGAFIQLLGD